jgi:hypothetical protein
LAERDPQHITNLHQSFGQHIPFFGEHLFHTLQISRRFTARERTRRRFLQRRRDAERNPLMRFENGGGEMRRTQRPTDLYICRMECEYQQHNTTQHNTTQHNTTQHNTTQHNTPHPNPPQLNTTLAFQPVQENVLPALLIVRVRFHMPGREAMRTCSAPPNVKNSYTSSQTTCTHTSQKNRAPQIV